MRRVRSLYYYKDYFLTFYNAQSDKVKDKIDLGVYYLQFIERIPSKFIGSTRFRNLYYLRIKQGKNIYRTFFCYDDGKVVVLMHGFQKKTQKTPKKEILKALKVQRQYFNEKKQ